MTNLRISYKSQIKILFPTFGVEHGREQKVDHLGLAPQRFVPSSGDRLLDGHDGEEDEQVEQRARQLPQNPVLLEHWDRKGYRRRRQIHDEHRLGRHSWKKEHIITYFIVLKNILIAT